MERAGREKRKKDGATKKKRDRTVNTKIKRIAKKEKGRKIYRGKKPLKDIVGNTERHYRHTDGQAGGEC